METVAVTFYNVVVWLHVSAVVIAFGPTFAFGIYFAVAGRKYPRALPAISGGDDHHQPLDGHPRAAS